MERDSEPIEYTSAGRKGEVTEGVLHNVKDEGNEQTTHTALLRAATVGIFGGTFDPIHTGHLILAERAREELGLDIVLLIPAYTPPHKTGKAHLTSPNSRLAMIALAIASNPAFQVSLHELEREGISYTVDTLRYLRETYPDAALTLLMGSDNARDFHTWRSPAEILELADIGVWERPGNYTSPEIYPDYIIRRITAPLMEISSTDIRNRVAEGKSIRYMAPDSVIDYIYKHGIYT